jgi:uncharacterized membrane protein YebE (DUF533 family)
MHVEMEDWKNGWYGISVGIAPDEIDRLLDRLNMIKEDHEQHFHISSDYKDPGGIGDIEIFVKTEEQKHNMNLSSRALAPGEEM